MPATDSISVLIADDHPIFRRGLCDVIAGDPSLRLAGEASDGEQAWRLLRELRPAAAVLDIHMPRRSGVQLVRDIKEHQLPIEPIILTMDGEEGLLREALVLGAKGYLLKENAGPDLIQAIHRVTAGESFISPALSGALLRLGAARQELRQQKPGLVRLTPTERQVLRLIAEDRTSKQVALLLDCSVRTVETHRQNISQKLELSGSHSLLRFAFDHKAEL